MGDEPGRFAQQLRSLRMAQSMSISVLARRVGVSRVTIWHWERGAQPSKRMIAPLARALQVSPEDLMLDDEDVVAGLLDEEQASLDGVGNVAETIERAKRMIADASGAEPGKITISIEY